MTIAALGLLLALAPWGAGHEAKATTAAAQAPVPALDWQQCATSYQSGFECATAVVPLDYSDPQGATINLAVIRRPASDPANRLGSLFFNPGGPGGAGTQDLPAFINFFAPELRARFDLVSWDPRGVGSSTAVQCFDSAEDQDIFFGDVPYNFFPVGPAQTSQWIERFAQFGEICAERNGALLEHVSTADSARDLDLLRQAVGDERLNYLGISYGTFLGATYANLFPGRVRALVLDGNVDPVAYMIGGREQAVLSTSLRIGSDKASAKTLDAFLDLCGAAPIDQCAFSAGGPAATRERWQTLLRRVREQPIALGGTTFTYAVLVTEVSGILFTVEPGPGFLGWKAGAQLLYNLWEASEPGAGGSAPAGISSPILRSTKSDNSPAAAGAAQTYAGPEQLFAVQCGDSPSPREPWVYPLLEAFSNARAGAVGSFTVWGDQPCADWPAEAADRYTGPWNRQTANPVLVIGNTFDPATPYDDAVAMGRHLARARLLTVDGYGHTVLLNPSACAKEYQSRYFVDGMLPPSGAVCQQDAQPFAANQSR